MEDHQNEQSNGNVVELHPQEQKRVEKLTAEEALRLQNLELRSENLAMRKELCKQEGMAIMQEERALNQESLQLRVILAAKYGISPEKLKVRRDGTIEEADK